MAQTKLLRSLANVRPSSMWQLENLLWLSTAVTAFFVLLFAVNLIRARMKFRRLMSQGIPIMNHSLLFGHLLVVFQFYQDWASDANFIQTFGYYMSKYWKKFFPDQDRCPPVVYVDVWPISKPMAFSMEAYVSNQMEIGHSLPKSPMQGEFLGPISNGKDLNCMHGEEWRRWRSRFNPGFSRTNIRTWIPAILEEAEGFVNVVRNLCGGNGNWGQVFPFEKICADLAFDVTGRVVLDTRMNSQSPHPAPFSVAYREQLERMEITLSPRKLLWRCTPIFKMLVKQKRNQLFRLLHPVIMDNIGGVIQGPRTVLRAAVDEFSSQPIDKGGQPDGIPESFIEAVFYQLMIFFFGGDDAISLTIPRIFKQLQLHPGCLEKLRQEHDTVLGSDPNLAREKILEAPHILDSLQYTLAVIKETLRLDPATITIREGQPDFAFRISGSDVPWPTDGFDLFDSSITIHRDAANFPRPLEFIPERYLVSEGNKLHPGKNLWRAFQLGPRRCIGQEQAIVVLKLVLVLVARNFDVEMAWEEWDRQREEQGIKVERQLVDGQRMYTTGKATSHNKDGAPVRVKVREWCKEQI